MPDEGRQTPLPPSLVARLAVAARYAISGVAPDTWFGPQQPLSPQAPPEVKGRQFDYPFGVNLSYVPRATGGISFAELRALADALPLLRAVIETRKDQIAALSYSVRARDPASAGDAAERAKAAPRLPRPPRPAPCVLGLAAHAARGHAGHRRGDALPALHARRRALQPRRHRRRDDHAADRRGRPLARPARPGLSADPARRAGGRLLLRRAALSAAQRARPQALRLLAGRADRADRQHRAAGARRRRSTIIAPARPPTPSPPCRRNGRSTRSASSRIISTR